MLLQHMDKIRRVSENRRNAELPSSSSHMYRRKKESRSPYETWSLRVTAREKKLRIRSAFSISLVALCDHPVACSKCSSKPEMRVYYSGRVEVPHGFPHKM